MKKVFLKIKGFFRDIKFFYFDMKVNALVYCDSNGNRQKIYIRGRNKLHVISRFKKMFKGKYRFIDHVFVGDGPVEF